MKGRAILLLAAMAAALIVASGVALAETFTCNATPPCYGTPEDDDITGTNSTETIYGLDGNDTLSGEGGSDTHYGNSGNDTLFGAAGSDTYYGGGGIDTIVADIGESEDSLDSSYGGRGNDAIRAIDGEADMINCGKGTDFVQYDDGIDTTKACENKLAI
jgi:hypothetical protein